MKRFSVWAPAAREVTIQIGSKTVPMRRLGSGWWEPKRVPLRGASYGYLVDGEGPFPDPRSQWQPDGVHGLSRRFDGERHRWRDQGWLPPPIERAVIYELHIGTFTGEGTFEAAAVKLGHLVDLGATHVELMPVHQFPGARGWGYDAASLFAVHASYGGPLGLMRFVDACHELGLGVILDVVYNHLGPEGNYLPKFGPYLTDRYGTLWGQAINLDGAGSDQVRRFICDNALQWLDEFHLDGLRLDAVHGYIDVSARPLLEQISHEVGCLQQRLGRPLTLIAESNQNDPRIVRSLDSGGMGLDLMWNDDFHHALHVALTQERDGYYQDFSGLEDLAATLCHGFVYGGRYAPSRQMVVGREDQRAPLQHLVAYLQNHDQVGNRALGDRVGHLGELELAKVGAAILMTGPFVPMIFQGEEWAATSPFLYFTDLQDPALGRAVRQGRRREFSEFLAPGSAIPDPQRETTFQRSKLHWSELRMPEHRAMYTWYRDLLALRRRCPDLFSGGASPEVETGRNWLVMRRGVMVIVLNLSGRRREIEMGSERPPILLASRPGTVWARGAISLPARTAAVLGPRPGA